MSAEFYRTVTGVDRKRPVSTIVAEAGFELGGGGNEFVHVVPRGEGDEVKLVFFQPDWSCMPRGGIPSDWIEEEFKKRSLVPDPRAHIRIMGLEPKLALLQPSVSVWCHDEVWYSLIFRYRGEAIDSPRYALLVIRPRKWSDKVFWFCGAPLPRLRALP